MALRFVLVMLAIAACSRTNRASPKLPPAASPRAPAAPVERPAPVLQEPWSEIDFLASDAELRKRFGSTEASDCPRWAHKTNGLCWSSDDRTGDQLITIYFASSDEAKRFTRAWGAPVFALVDDDESWHTWHLQAGGRRVAATLVQTQTSSTITLQPLMSLPEAIAWMTSLVGLRHEATTQKLGKRRSHGQPVCEGILCFFTMPPNDGGNVSGSIEFAGGVATHASYVAWCGPDCAMGPAILAAFDKAFGTRKTESRPYEESGELWTYHTYASTPGLVISSREYAPDLLFVCVGACD